MKKCPKCGAPMKMEEGVVYSSLPVMYGYICPECGYKDYDYLPDLDKTPNEKLPDMDEIFERAKKFREKYLGEGNIFRNYKDMGKDFDDIFKDVPEDTDEKTRKEIISFLRDAAFGKPQVVDGEDLIRWATWLENYNRK